MADVFVSYARSDQKLARTLAERLNSKGIGVWWDVELVGGERFREVVSRELEKAKVVLVIWSADSVQSPFVVDEADMAAAMGKRISVLVDGFSIKSAPLGFRNFQAVSISDDLGLERALQRLGLVFAQPDTSTVEKPMDGGTREEKAWEFVLAKRDPKLVEEFLKQYPDSKYVTEAVSRKRLIANDYIQNLIVGTAGIAGGVLGFLSSGWFGAIAGFIGAGGAAFVVSLPFLGDPQKSLKRQERGDTPT